MLAIIISKQARNLKTNSIPTHWSLAALLLYITFVVQFATIFFISKAKLAYIPKATGVERQRLRKCQSIVSSDVERSISRHPINTKQTTREVSSKRQVIN